LLIFDSSGCSFTVWFTGPFVASDRGREASKRRAGARALCLPLPPVHFFLYSLRFQDRTSPLAT
jgi:hypothetical protein